jgi:hypothetical protein
MKKNLLKAILRTGLIAGTLDIIAAFIWNYKVNPALILKFIASGDLGKSAFNGGLGIALLGLFFHYVIAFSFSAVLFILYPRLLTLVRSKYVVAVIFGLVTWLITNLVIVPLSQIGWRPAKFDVMLTGFGILIITIGLPVVIMADRYYKKHL